MQFSSASPVLPSIMRILSAPNLVFFSAFLFLGLDYDRYIVFKPLMLLGKALTLLATLLAFAKFSVTVTDINPEKLLIIIAVCIWDGICLLALIFFKSDRKIKSPQQIVSIEAEKVEMD